MLPLKLNLGLKGRFCQDLPTLKSPETVEITGLGGFSEEMKWPKSPQKIAKKNNLTNREVLVRDCAR